MLTRSFGTSGPDEGLSVATDSAGNTYVAGLVSASLSVASLVLLLPWAGSQDVVVMKLDTQGAVQWVKR